jgi:hypothetical protein
MPKWKQRILEAVIATALAVLTIQVITHFRMIARDAVPVSAWFSVTEIFVPDHLAGTDPVMVYDRTIFENVRGFWIVEVQRREYGDLSFTECTGYGINDYDVSDVIPENKVSLSWFIGRQCNLKPGTYRLRVSYSFKKDGWPVKDLTVLSNTFVVF